MNRICLPASITYSQAALLLESVSGQLAGPEAELDFAAVTNIDSTAVSLLLAWRRRAESRNIRLYCANLPKGISTLVELYGVNDLIPQDTCSASG